MKQTYTCDNCNNPFDAYTGRFKGKTNRFCSKKCEGVFRSKDYNIKCTVCKKPMKVKPSRIQRTKSAITCSIQCSAITRRDKMKGNKNHQYNIRGCANATWNGSYTRTSSYGYILRKLCSYTNANGDGHFFEHRKIVEVNYRLFDIKYFVKIDGYYWLRKDIQVHHIDGVRSNNRISNLQPVTAKEHRAFHKRGVDKPGELLETPVEDNQQPSSEKSVKVSEKVQRLGGDHDKE